MKTITVNASKTYDVQIGTGLLSSIGTRICGVHAPCKAAVISDSNVWPLYGGILQDSLLNAGFQVTHFVFPAGESSKNADTYIQILNFLAAQQITRSDLLIALGGGVVGDITGFAAATYLRGIPYMQVPTSLLAMVDSSVGGKTAIDLPAGKNLAGAFCQPDLVLCDIAALDTLPESIFRDGCAEVIKYGVLYDPALFCHLMTKGPGFDRELVVARCVELKRNVVMEDEFDTGARQKLNLGHTLGHGMEAQSNFQITHGQAVAAGMYLAAKIGVSMGICDDAARAAIHTALDSFCLPTKTEFSAEQLFTSALSDKKRSGGTVNLIIPKTIGDCAIVPIPVDTLESLIEAGLSYGHHH